VKNNRLFRFIKAGGIIVYPTESSFGIGCDPSNIRAIRKIIALKKRDINKNFIIISSSINNASKYIEQLSKENLKKVNKKWPGAHTWLLKSNNNCPSWLKKNNKIALRIPDFQPCQILCSFLGMAIISTSANLSGKKSLTKYREVSRLFYKKSKIIKGRIGEARKPSKIQDFQTGKILRS
jgi:L-threonylcarbamoyladenylate synthase